MAIPLLKYFRTYVRTVLSPKPNRPIFSLRIKNFIKANNWPNTQVKNKEEEEEEAATMTNKKKLKKKKE